MPVTIEESFCNGIGYRRSLMGQGRQYRIGSFNVNRLSRSTATRLRAQNIADIIRHEQMDLVALQEVLDEDALHPVCSCLGTGWESVWLNSRPKKGMKDVDHDPGGEGYAFLWDRRRFRKVQSGLLDGNMENFEPCIYTRYKVNRQEGFEELIRDPVYGRFTPQGLGGGNFELRLICTHIRYNGLDEESDRFFWKMRQNEFDVLTRSLYPMLADMVYGIQMPAYTILLGDYNMNLKRLWTKKPYIDTPDDGIRLDDKRIVTVQDQLTTLKRPKKADEETRGYKHNYDHFSYDKNKLSCLHPFVSRVDVVGSSYYSAFYDNYDLYREEISNHIPIVMTITPG